MIKRMILMLLLVALVGGGVFGFKIFQGMMIKKYMTAAGAPAQTVSTAKATMEDWQPKLSAVGSLRAVNGADLAAEVAGLVQAIHFESGQDVAEGAELLRLVADNEMARLQSLKASERLAEITYARDKKQFAAQAVSQAVLDSDAASLASLRAQVSEQQALVDKKIIRAPFAGRIGIRKVDLGQYLNPGTMIATLQQLDPIYADFTMPQQSLTALKVGQKVRAHSDAHPDQLFEGEITAINPKVEEETRNITARASFKNAEKMLLPGMFVKLEIDTGAPQRYVTLPQTAITYNPYGNTVYIAVPKEGAEGDKKALIAHQTFVTTGEARGDQIAVLSGVKEGDEVVTAGQIKLRNGAPITVNNEIVPKNDANPKMEDK